MKIVKKVLFCFVAMLLCVVPTHVNAQENEVINEEDHSILTTFDFEVEFNSSGSGYENQLVYVDYNFNDPNGSIEKIEYFEIQDLMWHELNGSSLSGRYGPNSGFQYYAFPVTSKFKIKLSQNPGVITGTLDVKLASDGSVIKTYDVNMNAVAPKVSVNGLKDEYTLGEVVDFSVETKAMQDFIDQKVMVKGSGAIDFDKDKARMEYFDENDQTWKPFIGSTFGPSSGFPFMNTSSKFRFYPNESGVYSGHIDIIDVATTQVYASQPFSIQVSKQVETQTNTNNDTKDAKKDAKKQPPTTGDQTNVQLLDGIMLLSGIVFVTKLRKE